MTDAILSDMTQRFGSDANGSGVYIQMAYTGDNKEIMAFR